jgi:hypothetical protein
MIKELRDKCLELTTTNYYDRELTLELVKAFQIAGGQGPLIRGFHAMVTTYMRANLMQL